MAMSNAAQFSPGFRAGFGQAMNWVKPEPGVRAVDPTVRTVDLGAQPVDPVARVEGSSVRTTDEGAVDHEALGAFSLDPEFEGSSSVRDSDVAAVSTFKQEGVSQGSVAYSSLDRGRTDGTADGDTSDHSGRQTTE